MAQADALQIFLHRSTFQTWAFPTMYTQLHAGAACRYDSHRSQILRADGNYQAGGGAFSADEAGQPPEDLSLYQYFSSSCYDDYNDGPKVQLNV